MSPLAISLRFLQTQPDQRLVELARAGHERAFEALVRRYRTQLLAYCRRVAPRGTPPEDILQQGLLLAWRALSSGAEVRDARAWLYRIVHNVAVTTVRAAGEKPETVLAETGTPGVDQLVEQRMAAREALAGLAGLPDLQRQVMVSAAIDGRSHEEIAAALGLSSGSVRGLIYRARSTLRAAAAAVIPAPIIEWAAGESGGAPATLVGAGSAGAGALILKGGGAILAVGAVVGTTAIVGSHHPHPVRQSHGAPVATASRAMRFGSTAPASAGDPGRIVLALLGAPAGTDAHASLRDGRHDGRSPGGGGHGGPHDGGGSQSTAPHGGDGSPGGSGGFGDHNGGGTTGGSDGGGDHHNGATTTGGSDGGGDHNAGTTSRGSDGGGHNGSTTTSGSDGGGDHGGSTTPTTTSGSDGGTPSGATTATSGSDGGGSSGSSSDGGSSGSSNDGLSTTTTTAATTNH